MRVSEAFPSKFLKAADFEDGDRTLTISTVEMEKVGEDRRPICYFRGEDKGLVLNKTNANTIAKNYGDDMREWRDCDIVLFATTTDFQGETRDTIRIRMPKRGGGSKPAPQSRASHDDDMDEGRFPPANAYAQATDPR